MKYRLAWLIIIIFIFVLNLSAHEHKKIVTHEKVTDSLQKKVDSTMINNYNIVMKNNKALEDKPFEINYLEEAFSHVHNKLVHFPVALTIISCLFTILSFRWKQFEFSIKYVVLIAAIFAIPAIFTGLYQAGNFIGEPKEWIVALHKILGILSLSILWIWSIFLMVKPLKRFAWIISLVSIILILITGFYGGVIAH
jgi:uncharacterized membrane protein